MRIMVIGSGGYIGQRLCTQLAASGDEVVPLSSSEPGGIDPLSGRLPEEFSVPVGVDAIVYLAQSPQSGDFSRGATQALSTNLLSAVKAAIAGTNAGVSRFVYASTGNVYRPGFTPYTESSALTVDNLYALTKVHAEQALALARGAIDIHILRLFGVYGPGQTSRLMPSLAHRILTDTPIELAPRPGEPEASDGLVLSLAFVDDLVDVFIRVARSGGPEILNVGGEAAYSIREIGQKMGQMVGRKVRFERSLKARSGDLVADTTLLRNTLGPLPTAFEIGLEQTLSALGTAS